MGDQLQLTAAEPEVFLYEGGHIPEELRRSLTRVRVGPQVTEIPDGAFHYCEKLIELQLNEGLQVIGSHAFRGCTALRSVILPSSVTGLRWEAFSDCSGVIDLQLNEGLRLISNGAFQNCNALRSVTIPSTITELRGGAFYRCSNLSEVIFLDGKRLLNQEFFSRGLQRDDQGLLQGLINREAIEEMLIYEYYYGGEREFIFEYCPLTTVNISISWAVSERMASLPRAFRLTVEERIHILRRLELQQDGNVLVRFPVVRGDGDDYVFEEDTYDVRDTNHETARSLYRVLQLIAFYELKESSIAIELAMWKSRIDKATFVRRTDCRVAVPDPAKSLIMEYGGFAGFLEPVIEGA